jgi:hypothetical protein
MLNEVWIVIEQEINHGTDADQKHVLELFSIAFSICNIDEFFLPLQNKNLGGATDAPINEKRFLYHILYSYSLYFQMFSGSCCDWT